MSKMYFNCHLFGYRKIETGKHSAITTVLNKHCTKSNVGICICIRKHNYSIDGSKWQCGAITNKNKKSNTKCRHLFHI